METQQQIKVRTKTYLLISGVLAIAMLAAAGVSLKKSPVKENKVVIKKSDGNLWDNRTIAENLRDEPLAYFEIKFKSGDNKILLKKLKLSISANSKDTLSSLANLKLYQLAYKKDTNVAAETLLKTVDKPAIDSAGSASVAFNGLGITMNVGDVSYFRIDGDLDSASKDTVTFKISDDNGTVFENNKKGDKSKITVNAKNAELSIATSATTADYPKANISVVSPESNQQISKGSKVPVKWSAPGIASSFGVDIVLFRREAIDFDSKKISIDTMADIIALNTNNSGKVDWEVPKDDLPSSNTYFVKIACSDDSSLTKTGVCSGTDPVCVNGNTECRRQPGCTGYQDYGNGQWYCSPQYKCSDFNDDSVGCNSTAGCRMQEAKVCVPGTSGFFEIK